MKEDADIRARCQETGARTRMSAFALKRFFANLLSEERFMYLQQLFCTSHSPPNLGSRLRDAVDAMREGRPVILIDDEDRENEADLIVAAEALTVPAMALLIRECSGIVCLCLTKEVVDRLDLPPMVALNESRFSTAFTVSIEARHGVTTGVSALDRVTTINAAVADDAKPHDLVRPGHVFPLCAHPNGVLGRHGHTEGAVDLARLAGFKPAAVLCELMNLDGTMARGDDIDRFARDHDLPVITIDELIQWRRLEVADVS